MWHLSLNVGCVSCVSLWDVGIPVDVDLVLLTMEANGTEYGLYCINQSFNDFRSCLTICIMTFSIENDIMIMLKTFCLFQLFPLKLEFLLLKATYVYEIWMENNLDRILHPFAGYGCLLCFKALFVASFWMQFYFHLL